MTPRFTIGDEARVRLGNPGGHCRVPGYLRGKRGRVTAMVGCFTLADDAARGIVSDPQPVYTVAFRAQDIWGDDGAVGLCVTAELWESYLEAVR